MSHQKLTQERIKKIFDYDPQSGTLKWKKTNCNRIKIGDEAGCIDRSTGYRQVYIGRRLYYTHRLIWLWVYGYFPEHQVDHINRNKLDNSLKNLREVSQSCNNLNQGLRKNNKSLITGVSWDKSRQRWEVKISFNGKKKSLGRYVYFENAVCARLAGEECVGVKICNQESPAFKYVKANIQGDLK